MCGWARALGVGREILICREDEGTGNREQGTGMAAGASKSLPLQGKVGRRRRVGRGRSPCGIDGLRAFLQENDLFRLSAKTQAFSPKATYRGPTGPISLKNVHWTFFRALDAPEPAAPLPGEGFWMPHLLDKSEFVCDSNSCAAAVFYFLPGTQRRPQL